MKLRFMNQKDKVTISRTKTCPPHRLPHKPPFTKPVTDENCHYHMSRLNILHHLHFCKYLRCEHYPEMKRKYKTYKQNKI